MRFGQTHVLKTAKGKLGAGLALLLFGAVAVLAAPTAADKLLCGVVPVLGAALAALGVRQDRAEKKEKGAATAKDDGKRRRTGCL